MASPGNPPSAHELIERVVLALERSHREMADLRQQIREQADIVSRSVVALETIAATDRRRLEAEDAQRAARGRTMERIWATPWVQTLALALGALVLSILARQAGVWEILGPLLLGVKP